MFTPSTSAREFADVNFRVAGSTIIQNGLEETYRQIC